MGKPVFKGDVVVSRSTGLRSYVNPSAYEPTPPKPEKEFHLPKWLPKVAVLAVGILFVVWFFFVSPVFRVKTVQIKGQARRETKKTINTLLGKNIFLIGGAKAEERIAKQQPGIKQIKVLRGIPSTVVVELVERDPVITWHTQNKVFFVDKDGYVFKESDGDYLKLYDAKNLPVTLGSRISSSSFINFVLTLNNELTQKTSLQLDSITIPETTFQIEVATKNGPKLKLDTSRDLSSQLNDINYVLQHNKDNSKNLIDVRVAGFAYIK